MNIHFITFGCKVNLYETENMKQAFSKLGYTICSKPDGCDIFVINSCTVTESGDKKIFKELRKLRRENPDAVIAVTGCLPQAADKADKLLPEADIITGTKSRGRLPEIISDYLLHGKRIISIEEYNPSDKFESMCNKGYTNNTRAFVKIQDGCNMFCTYCIIPYSRGRFRSKPLDELKAEVTGLAEAGYKEVVLVGINLSFYGIEFGLRLADAIEAVCQISGIERVRLGSLEPEMISDEDIKRMAAQKKLCPQFHLSLQSGCDRTLKAMNRRYTSNEYRILIEKLRAAFDNCAITTDVMVGFPGETDEDFNISAEFIESIGFSKIHVFPYSPRKGTIAAEMNDQIPTETKNNRAAKIMEISDKSHAKFLQSMVGTVLPVLFEREKSDNIPHGYTPNYTLVKIFTKYLEKSLRNRIFYVKIIRLEYDYCVGEIIT
ncbi:MAG: tRNA (N(6)-L-threonylcarbamoyladenosine(37)-C(2))-methylthiotransferase MtaB [Oscillospiraceae bacterium]|nr:tRNA (N(6)-L-threonylcarbamoyladenosine(37)-C(2))-methylthiotransferase MtaB [Oscillospiraceae bacterium]